MGMFEITEIDPISAGKILGMTYFGIGLIVSGVGGLVMLPQGLTEGGVFFVVACAGAFLYGIFAFVAGFLSALLYNLASSTVGGLRVGMEE